MIPLLIVAVLWTSLAPALAIGVGRSIRLADTRTAGSWLHDVEHVA